MRQLYHDSCKVLDDMLVCVWIIKESKISQLLEFQVKSICGEKCSITIQKICVWKFWLNTFNRIYHGVGFFFFATSSTIEIIVWIKTIERNSGYGSFWFEAEIGRSMIFHFYHVIQPFIRFIQNNNPFVLSFFLTGIIKLEQFSKQVSWLNDVIRIWKGRFHWTENSIFLFYRSPNL